MKGSDKRKKLGQCERCKGDGCYWAPSGKHGQYRGLRPCQDCKGTGKLPGVTTGKPSMWQRHIKFIGENQK